MTGLAVDTTDAPATKQSGVSERVRQRRVDAWNVLLLLLMSAASLVWVLPVLQRPLWYDEQWRAYHVSLWKGAYQGLPASGPMAWGWLVLEKTSTLMFGDGPIAFRLPQILALPALALASYALARAWCRPSVSVVVAAVTAFNGSVVDYGLQFKPYLVEVLVTVLILLLWVRARRSSGRRRAWALVGVGAVSLCSVPGVLIAGPLLLWEAGAGLRGGREQRSRLAGAVGGGVLGLLGALFLSGQTEVTESGYWKPFFLDVDAPSRALAGARSVLPEALTSAQLLPDNRKGHPFSTSALFDPVPGWIQGALTVTALVLLAAVLTSLVRRRDDRWGVAGTLAFAVTGILVAARLGLWPATWTRVNLFLLPLLVMLLGLGAEALLRSSRVPARRACAAALLVPAVLAVGTCVHWTLVLGDTGRHDPEPLLLDGLDRVGSDVRARAGRDDVLIALVNRKAVEVWTPALLFYLDRKHGSEPRFDPDRIQSHAKPTADLADVLAGNPPAVWVVSLQNTRAAHYATQADTLREADWCPDGPTSSIELTGLWGRFTPCPPTS